MIESIAVQGVATYSAGSAQMMTRLSRLNFVYGCNGAGKTTVSRLVAQDVLPEGCEIRWSASGPLQSFVYNRDFVHRSLAQSSQIRGIFTLGSATAETVQRIEHLKDTITETRERIENRKRTLNGVDGASGKNGELRDLHASFAETCFVAKRAHDASLGNAFTGVRGDKAKFRDRLLLEKSSNQASLQTLEYLTRQATSVYSNSDGREELIPIPTTAKLLSLEDQPIYSKVVVGKNDVDIAAMISRLGNSDWVRSGQAYLAANDELCPFCQQPTPATLKAQLDAYFDEAFAADTATLRSLVNSYDAEVLTLRQAIQLTAGRTSRRIDSSAISALLKDLEATWTANANLLKQKQREPSLRIALVSSEPQVQTLLQLILDTNSELQRHNTLVANRAAEQTKLTSEVWRYLLEEDLKDATAQYLQKVSDLNAAIRGLTGQITTSEQEVATHNRELRVLEQQITSVAPTVDQINGCLDSCGFTGFRLQTASQIGFYRLIRDDGSAVEDTLSEGERSFVAFLYFYHLLRGSESEHGTVGDRVVVIDDPVSSLDSNVLFAVSSLIRELYDPILNDQGMIRQLILLTHNVYFHKEVTCHPPQGARLRFWIIKKKQGTSYIESKETNPISSSYELLWQELHEENLSPTTLQNTMRRILENYFKMTGQVDMNALTAAFSARDRQLGRSLLSWTNAGSHNVLDDMHASVDEPTIEHFQEVFKKIFDQTGHGAHYTMMMTRN